MHRRQMANCLCLASPYFAVKVFYLPLNSLRISRSVSRLWIVARLSRVFFPFTNAISTFIFLFLLYTEIGTIVKPRPSSFDANSAISFLSATGSFARACSTVAASLPFNFSMSIASSDFGALGLASSSEPASAASRHP